MEEVKFQPPDPELAKRFSEFRTEHADDVLGGVADRVLHEDDKVKIWEMRLEPGEHSDLHRHDHDYYLVMMQGDRVAGVSKKEGEDIIIDLPKGGATMQIPRGATEWALNIGKETFYEILIELKD